MDLVKGLAQLGETLFPIQCPLFESDFDFSNSQTLKFGMRKLYIHLQMYAEIYVSYFFTIIFKQTFM